MNRQNLLRRAAIVAGAAIIALLVIFAPSSVSEAVIGCIITVGISIFAIRDQRRKTAETDALIAEARLVNDRAKVLLGQKPRKSIVS